VSKKAILIVAPGALGALILAWAAFSGRTEEEQPLKPPPPRPFNGNREVSTPGMEAGLVRPPLTPAPAGTAAAVSTPETAAIQNRVLKMEERLRELEAKREALTASNQELEKQVTEKWAEASARSTAEWRVKAWEAMLGLGESQKESLIALWTRWGREDAGRAAGREAWTTRETELRPQLTVEQAAKLHETAASQSGMMWANMGRSLGSMVGSGREEQTRIQQTIGDLRLPADMLLPEAHGADWPGLLREASSRARPLLTPEQVARLDKFGGNK